ncbi:MAG: hypothetical protein ACTSU2_08430 [Promethearchaeota archaeon]
MSKEKLIEYLDKAFDNGTPFIDYTSDYVYCLIPLGGGKWKEISYMIPDKELEEREFDDAKAYRMLLEEVEKGLAGDIEDFMLNDFRAFKEGLGDKPDSKKINDIIKELIENTEKYSKNLPIVKTKEDIEKVKGLL